MEKVKTVAETRPSTRDSRLNQKLELAKNPNSIIVISRTKRVTTLINLLTQTDIALSRIQNNMGDSIPIETAGELFEKFNNFITDIETYTINTFKLTNGKYFEIGAITALHKQSKETTPKKIKSTKEGNQNE